MLHEHSQWRYMGAGGTKLALPVLLVGFRLSEVMGLSKYYPMLKDDNAKQLKCYFYRRGWDYPHSTLQVSREKFLFNEKEALEQPLLGNVNFKYKI